jgi:hypothetical protein
MNKLDIFTILKNILKISIYVNIFITLWNT